MSENINKAVSDWEIGNNLTIFKGDGTTKEELDKEWQNFEATMTPDQQMKSDDESIRLYGKTNLERYKEKIARFDNPSSISEEVNVTDSEEVNIIEKPISNAKHAEINHMPIELKYYNKALLAKKYMKNANTVMMYPTETISELEALWNKMHSTVTPNDMRKNDDMCIQIFGMTNIELYTAWKEKLLKFNSEVEERLNNSDISNESKELRYMSANSFEVSPILEKCVSLSKRTPSTLTAIQEANDSIDLAVNRLSSIMEYTPMAALNPVIGLNPMPMYLPYEFNDNTNRFEDNIKQKVIRYNTIFDSTFRGESIIDISDIQSEWKNDIISLQNSYKENNSELTRQEIFAMGWHPDYDISLVENWENINSKTLERISEYYNYSNTKVIDIHEFVNLTNTDSADNDIKIERKKNLNPVYVVLVSGVERSLGGDLIRWWTRGPFCHSALGLDYTLNDLISYNDAGGEHQGLSKESLKFYTPDERIGVFTIFVNNEDYIAMKKNIEYYLNNKGKTHYSHSNIVTLVLGRPLNFQFDMICSQFVDRLLKFINVDITSKDSSLVSPNDFYRAAGFNKRIYKVYDGKIKDYNPKKIKKIVDRLLSSSRTKAYKEDTSILEVGAKLLKHKTTTTTQKINGICGNKIENNGGGKVSGDYHNAILQHGIENDKEDIDEYKELLGMYADTKPEDIVEEYNLWLDGEFNRLTKIFAVRDKEDLEDLRAYRLDDKHNDPSGLNYALCMRNDIQALSKMGYNDKEVKRIIISDYFAKIDNPDDLKKMLTARVNYSRKMFRLFKVMAKKNYQLLEIAESDIDDILSGFNLKDDEKYVAVKRIKSALNNNSKKFEVKPGVYDLRELGAGVICITPKLKNKELHTLARLIQQSLEWDVVIVAHGNTAPNINGIQDYKNSLDQILSNNKKERRNVFKEFEKLANEVCSDTKYAENILKAVERSFDFSKSKRNEIVVEDKENKSEIILNNLIEEQPKHVEHIEHILMKSSIKLLDDLTNEIRLECLGTNKNIDEDFDVLLHYMQVEILTPIVLLQCRVNALNKYLLNYADWIWTTQPVNTLKAGPFRSMNELLRQLVFEENFKKILLYNCNPGGYPIPKDIIKNSHVVIKYGTTFNFAEDATICDSEIK